MTQRPAIQQTVVFRLTITMPNSWAVGAFTGIYADAPRQTEEDGAPVRQPLQYREAADGEKAVHLPASSLVGGLRAHMTVAGSKELAVKWLGPESYKDEQSPTLETSRLRCLGAVLNHAGVSERTTTAIDAHTGAAKSRTLRTAESVKPGATLTWWILWDRFTKAPPMGAVDPELLEVLSLIASWRPLIGRGRSVGKGQGRLTKLEHTLIDRGDPEHLTWWLAIRPRMLSRVPQAVAEPPRGWRAAKLRPVNTGLEHVYEEKLAVVDALHLGNAPEPVPVEEEPGRSNHLHTGKKVYAESWKGVFRHRAEYILRVQDRPDDEAAAVIAGLFGGGRSAKKGESGGARGCLRFSSSDVHVKGRASSTMQVAIDRISGGTLRNSDDLPGAGSLFCVHYLPFGSTLTLQISSERPLNPAEKELLDYVVRDLKDGVIGIGGMTTRGFGTVAGAVEQENWR